MQFGMKLKLSIRIINHPMIWYSTFGLQQNRPAKKRENSAVSASTVKGSETQVRETRYQQKFRGPV